MRIAILGGTGRMGSAIARELATNHDLVIGSRTAEKAVVAVSRIPGARGTRLEEAAQWCEAAVLSVPFSALDLITSLSRPLGGKLVLSMVNPIRQKDGVFQYSSPGRSAAEAISAALPSSDVATAFNNIPESYFGSRVREEADVLVAAHSSETYGRVAALVGSIPRLRPLYAGPLSQAESVERVTVMILNLTRMNGFNKPFVRFVSVK